MKIDAFIFDQTRELIETHGLKSADLMYSLVKENVGDRKELNSIEAVMKIYGHPEIIQYQE